MERTKFENQPKPSATPAPVPELRAGELPAKPCCGNCPSALKHPGKIGTVYCVAMPPTPAPAIDQATGAVTLQNVYPEMQVDKLGCNALYGATPGILAVMASMLAAVHDEILDEPGDEPG